MAKAQNLRTRAVSQTHDTPGVREASSTAGTRTHCLTCHQLLPNGQDHPPVIGQKSLTKNDRLNAMDSIDPLFHFLDAIHGAIIQLMDSDSLDDGPEVIVRGLAWLAEDLSAELQRRTDWLYEISTPHQATQAA